MSASATGRNSLPYVLIGTVVGGLVIGALMYTIGDPIAQALFSSPAYASDGTVGSNLLRWFVTIWEVLLMIVVLVAIMFEVWVYSRQSGGL